MDVARRPRSFRHSLFQIAVAAVLVGLPTVVRSQCPPGFPVDCGTGLCCPAGNTCNTVNAQLCCPPGFPVSCQNTCCPAGAQCSADGSSCGAVCPPDSPVDCGNGRCCPAGNTCNTVNPQLCCLPGFPVPCQNTCCPAGDGCSPDGASCVVPNPCTDAGFPVDCGDGFCCPGGDRCAQVLVADVVTPFCCLDLPPEPGCCPDVRALAGQLESTTTSPRSRSGGSKCRRSTKVRPFDVLQIPAGSAGVPAFDTGSHEYSVGFALGRSKKGGTGADVVLKVPIVFDDSTADALSVMIPPFLLKNESHGKADVFLVTDGVMSDTCLSRVRIAKLPRSASTVPGLATLSWLRANRTLYDMARPSLGSAAAASFVTPTILADVDTATASVGNLVPSFDLGGKGTPLTKTARQSDRLLTGILRAGQKVGDAGFASACAGWIQAMAKAKDANDASLGAAEATYAKAVLGASGSSAQSVAKFSVACGSVTSAGVAAAAVLIGGGAVPASGVIDAQAAANAICGATVNTTTVVTGVTALATGAMTPGTGTTTYGKTLLTGSAKNAASAITNYGRVNLPTAKLCGCPDPSLKGAVDTAITVIVVGGHITQMAPEVCLPDVTAQAAPHPVSSTTTTTLPSVGRCDEQQVAGGDTADTRNIELGKTSGTATLDYNTFSIKDRIIVSYQGSVLFDTGCVGTSASQPINFAGSSTQLTVEVMPNCEGGTTGTAWQYTVHCPP